MSADGLISTKEQPGALDGFERAKPDEPIFTLQGGDPIAVRLVKVYIWLRRRAALKIADEVKQQAELLRCTEAERQLWAMEEYLRSGKAAAEADQLDETSEPVAIDLHDRRVNAVRKISYMRGDLEDMLVNLLPDWLAHDENAPEWLMHMLPDQIDRLHLLMNAIEPRRLFKSSLQPSSA